MTRYRINRYRRLPGIDGINLLPSIILFPKIECPTTNRDVEWHERSMDFRFLLWGFTISVGKAVPVKRNGVSGNIRKEKA